MAPKRDTGERRPKTTLPATANAASTKLYTFLRLMSRLCNSQRQAASEPPGRDHGKRRCKPPSQKLINSNASVGQKSPTTNDLANVGIYLTIFSIDKML